MIVPCIRYHEIEFEVLIRNGSFSEAVKLIPLIEDQSGHDSSFELIVCGVASYSIDMAVELLEKYLKRDYVPTFYVMRYLLDYACKSGVFVEEIMGVMERFGFRLTPDVLMSLQKYYGGKGDMEKMKGLIKMNKTRDVLPDFEAVLQLCANEKHEQAIILFNIIKSHDSFSVQQYTLFIKALLENPESLKDAYEFTLEGMSRFPLDQISIRYFVSNIKSFDRSMTAEIGTIIKAKFPLSAFNNEYDLLELYIVIAHVTGDKLFMRDILQTLIQTKFDLNSLPDNQEQFIKRNLGQLFKSNFNHLFYILSMKIIHGSSKNIFNNLLDILSHDISEPDTAKKVRLLFNNIPITGTEHPTKPITLHQSLQ